jgi:integrase
MGIKMKAEKGNRPTSREEYDQFRAKAREMGIQSMATAAAIAFELVRRTTDVFGYIREEGDEDRGFFWEDFRPGESFAMRQGKTGTRQVIPLRGEDDQVLYPALEEELARQGGGEGHIVINEDTGERYTPDESARVFRKIRVAAGLPEGMSFTGFRHGGATELGDVGIEDIRPISGHITLGQTTVYNKVTEKKARRIGETRRAAVALGQAKRRADEEEK